MHPRHLLTDATVIMVESAAVVQTQKRHSGREEDTRAALGGKKRHDLSPWSLFDTVLQENPGRGSRDKKSCTIKSKLTWLISIGFLTDKPVAELPSYPK